MPLDQEALDKLDALIASGVQQTTYADGRSVRLQTGADLLNAREKVQTIVSGSSPSGRRRRLTVMRVGRG